jgi:hypothetical protein
MPTIRAVDNPEAIHVSVLVAVSYMCIPDSSRITGDTEVNSHKIASGWPTIQTERDTSQNLTSGSELNRYAFDRVRSATIWKGSAKDLCLRGAKVEP